MTAIKKLIKEIGNLKPVPAVINQILTEINKPNSSMGDIADIIVYDPSITANILRMCNSAFFGLPRKIESIQEAITMIGLEQILDLILMKAGGENFKGGQDGYGLHEGELWKHAVSSAIISKELALKLKTNNSPQMIFTAALLKDIGKVILDRFVGDSFSKIYNLVQNKGYTFRDAEKKVIGIDHAELGGLVAEMWDFPKDMANIIKNHHLNDNYETIDTDTKIVYLADSVCMMMGIGGGSDGLAYKFHKNVLKELKVSPIDLQSIIADFAAQINKVEELLRAG